MSSGFFEKVAADKSQVGFDYQDLVCLEYLIDMKPDEIVGLEIFDDVHHERISGRNALIQVKHSVNDGNSLTNRDIDLWKTLYNWSEALDQLDPSHIEFIFYTNKKMTNQRGIVQLMNAEQLDLQSIIEFISEIKSDIDSKDVLKDKESTVNTIKCYVDHIYSLTDVKKKNLFSKIKFIFSVDDIFQRLSKKVEYFSISDKKSLDVVYQLIGVFRKNKYDLIKSGKKVSIDYSTFRKQFQFDRIIQITQDRKIDFSRYHRFT